MSITPNALCKRGQLQHTTIVDCLTLTFQRSVTGVVLPDIFLREGSTNRLHVTVADTGLPGSPKNNLVLSLYFTVANVVGFL